jgi:long-chain acyl-CoA synthetase
MQDRPWYANWPKGLPTSLEYPKVPIHRFLESAAKMVPAREALVFQINGETLTYAEFLEQAGRFATALARLGVRKGDVVAVQLPNSIHCAVVYYGILIAGGVYCPCNPLLSFKEIHMQLVDSGAKVFIVFQNFLDKFLPIRHDTAVKDLIVTGIQELLPPHTPMDVKEYGPHSHSLAQLLADTPCSPPTVKIDPEEDLAHLAYTGGTTGVPKGVMVTHQAAVINILQVAHWCAGGRPEITDEGLIRIVDEAEKDLREDWEYPTVIERQKVLAVVPFAHTMGVNGFLNTPVYMQSTIVIHPRLDMAAYFDDIVKYNITGCGGAPQLLIAMLAHPDFDKMIGSQIRTVGSGAAPLPLQVLQEMQRRLPQAIIQEGYGLTEMVAGVTTNPANRSGLRKPGSVGLPLFDTDLKIVDLDDPEVEIDFNEIGEICVRGPQMMKGYWKRPDETAIAIRDGWMLTGDIGYLDEDGYLWIVDRKKDMLLYNAHNVYPRQLEDILFSHRAVANCAVIGKPHSLTGEIPKAFVQLKPDAKVTERELMDFVNVRVADYKRVREIEFVPSLPLSYAGKILKRELRAWEIERMKTGETTPETKEELGL